jgi:tRNA (cytidine/uridine-2'-O-)-methyltransferase
LANKGHNCGTKLQKTEFSMRIALYQPEIAGNMGAVLRLSACLNVKCDIIEPCGFPFSDKSLKRAGMDYADAVEIERHQDAAGFIANAKANQRRIVLMTTKGSTSLFNVAFQPDDIILMGSESSGVPDDLHAAADLRIRIPMLPPFRSLNVSVAAGIALAEALRQTGQLPPE